MPRITAIRVQDKRKNRCSIFVDQEFFSGVDREVVVKIGLHEGQEVAPEDLRAVLAAEESVQAREKCLRLLDKRARTRFELAQYLQRSGVEEEVAGTVLARLQDAGMINDQAYARAFIQERVRQKNQGKKRLRSELYKRGIAAGIIDAALDAELPENEDQDCEALAGRKARSYRQLPPAVARRRLAAFLSRQGFGWESIQRALRRIYPGPGGIDRV
ncbi:RecX family transcriptional regulator [candidate division FCPU426 bacterium]|nr:RecX family transcriptional regulator [candidate division FCPU426 bacterium]